MSNLRTQVHLQTVVVRVRLVGRQPDRVEARIWQARGRIVVCAADKSWDIALGRQVVFPVVVLEAVRVANVRDSQDRTGAELTLHTDTPLIAGWLLVLIDRQASDSGR